MPRLAELPAPPASAHGWPWTEECVPIVCKQWPRISIVTPSYNQAGFLEGTIRSVLLQGYANLELIVLDGGSSDGSIEIIRKYDPWLTHWSSEPDRGQSHAINKGLAQCSGDVFNWLNSDDQLAPGALADIGSRWAAKRPHVLIGRCLVIDQASGAALHDWHAQPPRQPLDFIAHTRVVMPQPSSFLDARLVRELGGVREDLHYVMDWELYLRITLELRGQLVAKTTPSLLAMVASHAETKTNRAATEFQVEAETVLRGFQPELRPEESRELEQYLWVREAERLVGGARPSDTHGLLRLGRLLAHRPDLVQSRFFWGALRRSLVPIR